MVVSEAKNSREVHHTCGAWFAERRSTMRKLILFVVVSAISLGWAAPSFAQPVRIYESHDDSAISEGETIIVADPDLAYATASNYVRWTAMFPDIREVAVTRQAGVDALVTLIHADGHRDNLHFHNRPASHTVWFEDTGGRATVWAEITFTPGEHLGMTRVHSRIYADMHGFVSLFVSDNKIRNLRRQRIFDDLTHLRSYFAAAAAATTTVAIAP
jgi:hypothetical protein